MQDAPSVNTTGRRYPQQMPADRHRNDGDDDDEEEEDIMMVMMMMMKVMMVLLHPSVLPQIENASGCNKCTALFLFI